MNNSNDYYTRDDVMLLTGKASLGNLVNKVRTYKLGNRTIYLRKDVDNFIADVYANHNKEMAIKIAKMHIKDYNITLSDWCTISCVTQRLGITRERVYQVSSVRGKSKIQAIYYAGIWLFNKHDIAKI